MAHIAPTPCHNCAQPSPDHASICWTCARRLRGLLLSLARYGEDLPDSVTRTDRHTTGGARPLGAEQPIPINLGAADTLWVVGNTVVVWMSEVAERIGAPLPKRYRPKPMAGPPCAPGRAGLWRCRHESCDAIRAGQTQPPHPVAAAATWLADHIDDLRQHPDATDAYDELMYAFLTAERLADGPLDRWYAGPCQTPTDAGPCPAELYARPGAHTVVCPTCGTRHDCAQRREWLLDQASEYIGTASMLAAAITAFGRRVTPAAIRGLAHRRRLYARDPDEKGRPRYRLGDVVDLLAPAAAAVRGVSHA